MRLLGFPAGGLAPGDYELVLQVLDRSVARGAEAVAPFRIAAPD